MNAVMSLIIVDPLNMCSVIMIMQSEYHPVFHIKFNPNTMLAIYLFL